MYRGILSLLTCGMVEALVRALVEGEHVKLWGSKARQASKRHVSGSTRQGSGDERLQELDRDHDLDRELAAESSSGTSKSVLSNIHPSSTWTLQNGIP